MDETIEKKLKDLEEGLAKLKELTNDITKDNPIMKNKYRYCVVRELSGYGTEDWDALLEWAKRQESYLHFTFDEEKDAFYFNAYPEVMTKVGMDKSGVYICADSMFNPKVVE
jgi:hypothetical protein